MADVQKTGFRCGKCGGGQYSTQGFADKEHTLLRIRCRTAGCGQVSTISVEERKAHGRFTSKPIHSISNEEMNRKDGHDKN
jgi:hypothetical protein